MRASLIHLAALSVLFSCQSSAQPLTNLDFPHNFTQHQIIPSGCLVRPPSVMAPPDAVDFDETFTVGPPTGQVRIRAWRIGCHEPNRSVIAIAFGVPFGNLTDFSDPFVRIRPVGSEETYQSGLALFSDQSELDYLYSALSRPDLGLATLFPFRPDVTFVVHHASANLTIDDYNGALELQVDFPFEPRNPGPILIPIPAYDPEVDSAQFEAPPFHGRYSGQWVVDGLPNTGLLLQIGEVPGTTRNFMFAIWITYLFGQPTWVVGNIDFEIGSSEINIEMRRFEGGSFFTDVSSFPQEDISSERLGTMTIRAIHCNEIEADIDLSEANLGTAQLTLSRLIRIAGYDCDQTQ